MKFWFLDLQTTGTSPTKDSIIEAAWTPPAALQWPPSFRSLSTSFLSPHSLILKPDEETLTNTKLLARIQRLTGLTKAELEKGSEKERLRDDLLPQMQEPHLCVVHYAPFEKSFLYPLLTHEVQRNAHFVCTHRLAKIVIPGLSSYSLRAVAGYLGHPLEEAKRAQEHLKATALIFQQLLDLLHQQGKSFENALDLLNFQKEHGQQAKKNSKTTETRLTRVEVEQRLSLPESPGVYRLVGSEETTLYVGKATSLKSRVNSYFRGRKSKGGRLNELTTVTTKIGFLALKTPLEAALVEDLLIKKIDPPYNRAQRRGQRALCFLHIHLDDLHTSLSASVSDLPPDLRTPKEGLQSKAHSPEVCTLGPFASRSSLETSLKMLLACFPKQNNQSCSKTQAHAEGKQIWREVLGSTWQGEEGQLECLLAGCGQELLRSRSRELTQTPADLMSTLANVARQLLSERIRLRRIRRAEKDSSKSADDESGDDAFEPCEPSEAAEPSAPAIIRSRLKSCLRTLLEGALVARKVQRLRHAHRVEFASGEQLTLSQGWPNFGHLGHSEDPVLSRWAEGGTDDPLVQFDLARILLHEIRNRVAAGEDIRIFKTRDAPPISGRQFLRPLL